MKKVHVIEEIQNDGSTVWVISLTDSNPSPENCFTVPDKEDAFRIKKMIEQFSKDTIV